MHKSQKAISRMTELGELPTSYNSFTFRATNFGLIPIARVVFAQNSAEF